MRRLPLIVGTAALALVVAGGPAVAAVFYVRTTGDDAADGRSPGSAFATIRRAAESVNNPGDTIVIGPGTYAEGDLAPARNGIQGRAVVFRGDPTGVATTDSPGEVIVRPPVGRTTGFLLLGRSHVTIEHLAVEAASDACVQVRPSPDGLTASENVTLSHVTVRDCVKRGIDVTAGGVVTIRSSTALRNGTGGIVILGTSDVRPSLDVAGNTASGNEGPGILAERVAGGSIRDNVVRDNRLNGILVRDSRSVAVVANDVRVNGDGGIRVDVSRRVGASSSDVAVSGNTIVDNVKAGISFVAMGDIAVNDNTVVRSETAGVTVEGMGTPTTVSMIGNEVTASGDEAIYIEGATAGLVEKNVLVDNQGAGVLMRASSGVDLFDNDVARNAAGGLLLGRGFVTAALGDVSVRDCRLEDNVGGTIDIVAGGAVVVSGNSIPSADNVGISLAGLGTASATIHGNFIPDAGIDAIDASQVAEAFLSSNTATDPGEYGIKVRESGAVAADGNVVARTGDAGIWLQGEVSVQANENRIDAAAGVGLSMQSIAGAMSVRADDNQVTDLGSHGIVVIGGGGGGGLAGNQITRAGGQGLLLERVAGVTVARTTIATAGFNGLLARASRSVAVVASTISDVNTGGINLESDGEVRVVDSSTARCADSGISVVSPAADAIVEVNGNVVVTSGAQGVFVAGAAGGSVDDNQVSGSSAAGILIRASSNLSVSGNTVQDNLEGGINIGKGDTAIGRNIVADRNVVRGSVTGIQVFAGGEVRASGNTIEGSEVVGISVVGDQATDAQFDDNVVAAPGSDGLLLSGVQSASLARNEINDAAEVGVRLVGTGDASLIANSISDSGQDGVQVTGRNRFSAIGNSITGSSGSGIRLQTLDTADAFDVEIVSNTLRDQVQGIFVDRCSGGRVVDNTVENNTLDGILFRSSAGIEVSGNEIRNSGRNGVAINTSAAAIGSGFALHRNLVADSGDAGVTLYARGDVAAAANEITRSGSTSLSVQTSGRARVRVAGSHLRSGRAHGLFLAGVDKGQVMHNQSHGHGDTGMTLRSSAHMVVANNLVYGNTSDGLAIGTADRSSPEAEVINNTIYGNGGRGIVVGSGAASSAGALVINNIIESNTGTGIAIDRRSLDGYISGFNMNSDGYGDDTPRSPFDQLGPAEFVAPAGADGLLGGDGYEDDDFHLRQVLGGDAVDSPAVDAGSATIAALGLDGSTARGGAQDVGRIDLGFHYDAASTQRVSAPSPFMPIFVRAGGSADNDGSGPDRALASIRDAGLQAGAGVTVVVGPGTYVEPETIRVRNGAGAVAFVADRLGVLTGDAPGNVIVDAAGGDTAFVLFDSDDVVVDGFHVTNAATAAIQVRDGADRAVVRNNVVYSNDRRGVEVRDADDALIDNNLIYANRTGGIQVQSSDGSIVRGNTVYANGENGITVGGSSVAIGRTMEAHAVGATEVTVATLSPQATVALSAGDAVKFAGDSVRYRVVADTMSAGGQFVVAIDPALARAHAASTSVSNETLSAVNTTVVRNIVAENQVGIQVRLNSQTGYICGANVVPDGIPGVTQRCDSDIIDDPFFVDPYGPDLMLGGAGFADDDFRLVQTMSPAVDLSICEPGESAPFGSTDPNGLPDSCPGDAGYHYGSYYIFPVPDWEALP